MESEDIGKGCGATIFVVVAIVLILLAIVNSLENLDTFIFGIIGLAVLFAIAFLFFKLRDIFK